MNIFVNHLSAGVLNKASPSNLGFSDSAEIFVFLAGVSTYLAYGRLGWGEAWATLWRRAGKLYGYNLAIIGLSWLALEAVARWTGAGGMINALFVQEMARQPLATQVWHVVSLQQSVGYSVVLRLYVGLMLMAPALLWLATKRWWLALPPAVAIWALAGTFGWIAHDSLTHVHLVISILPWTLVFACGLALGAGLSQGVRMPRSPFLLGAASAMVVSYLVMFQVLPFWPELRAWAQGRELHFWLGASKTYESPLRVLHLLSLVYIFTALRDAPVIRLIHQAPRNMFLARLGRRSLEVFTFGAVYALAANEVLNLVQQAWGKRSPEAVGFEVAVVALGLAAMGLIADRRWPFGPRAAAPDRAGPATARGAA